MKWTLWCPRVAWKPAPPFLKVRKCCLQITCGGFSGHWTQDHLKRPAWPHRPVCGTLSQNGYGECRNHLADLTLDQLLPGYSPSRCGFFNVPQQGGHAKKTLKIHRRRAHKRELLPRPGRLGKGDTEGTATETLQAWRVAVYVLSTKMKSFSCSQP